MRNRKFYKCYRFRFGLWYIFVNFCKCTMCQSKLLFKNGIPSYSNIKLYEDFSSMDYLGTSVKNQLAKFVWVYFWTLFCLTTCMFIISSISHCLYISITDYRHLWSQEHTMGKSLEQMVLRILNPHTEIDTAPSLITYAKKSTLNELKASN